MNVNCPTPQRPIEPSLPAEQTEPVRYVRSSDDADLVNQARKKFLDDGETEFLGDTLSAEGYQLVKAVVSRNKPGAPGVQVSTFAVDGAQSNDMMVIKRVPPTEDGPNLVLYMPEDDVTSFHEFKDAEEMTAWLKDVANDPTERKRFTQHFSNPEAPKQQERVNKQFGEFAAGDINAVVGSFGHERGDIFERLNKDASVPPAQVDGLVRTQLYKLEPDGKAFYVGYRPDGEAIVYSYDAYGNLQGGGQKKDAKARRFYFVQNGLNQNKPLEPMTFNEFRKKITSVSLDNVRANDLMGLYDEFLKQLRSPGHGLATALKALGLSDNVANSIETILKDPIKGTLLELNHDNRVGKVFGVDKAEMDANLERVGSQIQSNIPHYGKWRKRLENTADVIEQSVGTPELPTTEVRT
ncbi:MULTISPECIES: DUF6543 domain-containing protein [Pseudomonas]|uniref:dermonecrotic toxin domain-containing protein n=1 Tax=Pseudomonas TaxID=286 RepID=UPI001C0A83CF|nr:MULTISPECIES: DUF6543 domain-containing protein [Pseudomonas]VCU63035.1 hypothetical protein [Pseudomonas synxantha]